MECDFAAAAGVGWGSWLSDLLREAGVVVHPGSFYGIGGGGRVVVSLIGPEGDFAEGVRSG